MEQPLDPPDLQYACRRCDGPCEEEGGLCEHCIEDEKDLLLEDYQKDEELYN